jgi:hypothetical protein
MIIALSEPTMVFYSCDGRIGHGDIAWRRSADVPPPPQAAAEAGRFVEELNACCDRGCCDGDHIDRRKCYI